MREFTDENGQKWIFHLTWDKAEQISARVERPDSTPKDRKTFDLLNPTDKEQVEALVLYEPTGRFNLKNGRCLVAMFYVLCEEQCKERKMSPEQFGQLMMSGTFAAAYEAFLEEFGNFIQDPDRKMMFQDMIYLAGGMQSAALSEASRTLRQQRTVLDAHVTKMIAESADQMEREMEKAVAELGTTNSSKSAGRSASTPASKRRGKS